jgi:hypothetical protein
MDHPSAGVWGGAPGFPYFRGTELNLDRVQQKNEGVEEGV